MKKKNIAPVLERKGGSLIREIEDEGKKRF
jgi:hypothetical protein